MKAFLLPTTYMLELRTKLAHAKGDKELFNTIVNAPFKAHSKGFPLGLSIVVLLLVNKKGDMVDRIALADTESAKGALAYSVKKFNEIRIPLSNKRNAIVQAIKENKYQVVSDWDYLFTPELSAQEARFNQAGAGIGTSVVYPLTETRDGGALIFSYYLESEMITKQHHKFMQQYAHLVAKKLKSN